MTTKRLKSAILVLTATQFLSGISLAQEEFSVDEDVSAFPSPDLNDLIDSYLDKRGWQEGENTKSDGSTFFIAIGKGNISAGRTHPNFIVSRQLAFDKGMLDAKKKMLQYMETKIETNLESFYSEPSQARQQALLEEKKREGLMVESAADITSAALQQESAAIGSPLALTFADKAENMLRTEAAKKLKALGFDPAQPISQQELQAITSSESFSKVTATVAQGRLVGMQAAKVIEFLPENKNGELGVVTIQSDRLQAIADAIYGNSPKLAPSGAPKKPISQQIPKNKGALISQFGVQSKRNEKGEYCLVAFGQSAPRTESSRSMQAAEDKAKITAQGLIRQFAGEIGSVLESSEASESVDTYADKMQDYQFDDSYEEKIQARAKGIVISGIQNIKRWKSKHPLTGHAVAGSVLSWCPSSGLAAKAQKRKNAKAPEAQTEFSASEIRAQRKPDGRRTLNADQAESFTDESADVDEDDF